MKTLPTINDCRTENRARTDAGIPKSAAKTMISGGLDKVGLRKIKPRDGGCVEVMHTSSTCI